MPDFTHIETTGRGNPAPTTTKAKMMKTISLLIACLTLQACATGEGYEPGSFVNTVEVMQFNSVEPSRCTWPAPVNGIQSCN